MDELMDYHPYGTERSSWSSTSGKANTQKTYIGEYSDDETGLSYLNARYYDPERGQFLSQDPAFLDLENSQAFSSRYQRLLEQHLFNPQNLNSYSCGLNNPVTNRDPQGEVVPLILGVWAGIELGLSAYDAYATFQTWSDSNSSSWNKGSSLTILQKET